jgi:LuxR family maltose regulon positive regulatory protein
MTEKLGRYEILEEIGRGGFAVVYRAHDTQLDRLVALKELRPILLADPGSVKDFRREARNIARLGHPHVVTIYDVYEAEQRQFIVMQLVDGSSLEELIARRGRLSWSETVEIIEAVAEGLDYAHTRGILHRDLKPANILLDSNHGPMLSDFGLAKLIGEAGTSITAGGGVVGTPHYIAPEVWEGQGTTRQSDVYALGCILYEMLIAEKLFPGETPPTVMMAHFTALALPNTWPEGVPSEVADVLATALAQKPTARYATAGEMAEALATLVKSETITPQPEPAQSGTRPVAPPILATKLYIPPTRPKVVLRPRLIERLNEGLHHKLALISAPAGFGKTTLVSEWIAGCQRPVAWLSLDEGDNDLTRFLTYLVAALQTIAANIGEGMLAALQSPQPPPTESILTALLNDITTIPDNFALVLDDYHLIEAKPVDHVLTFLLEHLPPQMHLVIATREDPPLPLARLRVRGQLTELRVTDLRFTPAEAAGFLNQVMGLNLAAEEIAALEIRTEGWIAGLQLAAISMQGHQDATSFIKSFTGSHHFVLDYLVEEVLHQQSESVQTFLLRTSILDRLSGPLCDAVLGRGAAEQRSAGEFSPSPLLPRTSAPLHLDPSASGQETLEYIEQANLFLVPLDNERRWYRYHHLFADLLRQRLHQSIASSTTDEGQSVAELHSRASVWYEHNGSPADAIRHALAAEDFERAAGLIELAWPAMDSSFQSATWLGWVKTLPDELVRARPVLSVGYAWAFLNGGELEAGEAQLRDVEQWLNAMADMSEQPEAPVAEMVVVDEEQFRSLPASIATARAYHAQALGDVPGSVAYARRALDLLPEGDHLGRGPAAALLGIAYWASGDLEAAHRALTEAMAGFQMAGNMPFALSGTYALADIRVAQGRLLEAVRTYEMSLQLATGPGEPVLRGTGDLYLGLSELHREQGDLEAAIQHLLKSEELGEQAALPDWPYRLCRAQARLKEIQGDLDGALDLLQEAERQYFRGPVPDVRPIAALKTRVWLGQGRLTEALGWARERGLSVDDDLSYLREFEHITLARVLIAEYKSDRADRSILEAMGLLERLLKAAEEGGRTGSVIEVLVLEALAYEAQGNIPLALAPLERALALAEPEGYVRIFVDEGIPMAQLLSKAAAHGMMPDYIDKLLAAYEDATKDRSARRTTEPSPSSREAIIGPSSLVEPLSQRELEVLQLIAQGLSNHEISERLFLALSTVKGYNRNIFGKLQVQRRTEAVARARELGLL